MSSLPDNEVSTELGAIGVVLFVPLFLFCSLASFQAVNKYARSMFISAAMSNIFEIPRYVALIIEHEYKNQDAYVCHMIGCLIWLFSNNKMPYFLHLGNSFFFVSFSFACYMLHDAVDLSDLLHSAPTDKSFSCNRIMFEKRSLVAANALFALFSVFTSIDCLQSSDLGSFFKSSESYKIYTYIDALKNIIFAGSLVYFALAVRKKLMTHLNDFPSKRNNSNERATVHQFTKLVRQLQRSLRKLMAVMITCLVCFILRFIMLLIKALVVENGYSNPFESWMPPYGRRYTPFSLARIISIDLVLGMLWWFLADFIPRSLPIVSFLVTFRKPRSSSISSGSEYQQQREAKVRLALVTDEWVFAAENSENGDDDADVDGYDCMIEGANDEPEDGEHGSYRGEELSNSAFSDSRRWSCLLQITSRVEAEGLSTALIAEETKRRTAPIGGELHAQSLSNTQDTTTDGLDSRDASIDLSTPLLQR